MPGVYVAAANSHFGAHAKRETEHLKTSTKLLRGKIHSEVKFNEKQKPKSFLNQFSLSQHNIITECFSATGLLSAPGEGRWVGIQGEQDQPKEALLLQLSTWQVQFSNLQRLFFLQMIPEFCFLLFTGKIATAHEKE